MVAAVAIAACGGDTDASAATKLDTTRLAAIERLSPARYAVIERVYVAAVAFDKFNRPGVVPTQGELEAASRAVLRACRALDVRDPLLGPMRASCPAAAGLINATVALGACAGRDECAEAMRATRAAVRRVITSSRVSDRAVKMTGLAAGCKRALVTPQAGYTLYRRFETAIDSALRALESGSEEDLAAAITVLSQIDLGGVPTGRQMLRRLRSSCR